VVVVCGWVPTTPRSGGGTSPTCRIHRRATVARTSSLLTTTPSTALQMADESTAPPPACFRDGEVLGLRYMQEGQYEEALECFKNAMKLPGSRRDIIRTKARPGPSPVGGAVGGFVTEEIWKLDEFEFQAAHYNMACAYAQLGDQDEAIGNLKLAFDYGFDNYATVRGDPDLQPISETQDFLDLMEEYDNKNWFNPFGFFK